MYIIIIIIVYTYKILIFGFDNLCISASTMFANIIVPIVYTQRSSIFVFDSTYIRKYAPYIHVGDVGNTFCMTNILLLTLWWHFEKHYRLSQR